MRCEEERGRGGKWTGRGEARGAVPLFHTGPLASRYWSIKQPKKCIV